MEDPIALRPAPSAQSDAARRKPCKREKPLQSMLPKLKADLRRRFSGPRNIDWLGRFVRDYIQDNLLRFFPSADPPCVVAGVVEDFTRTLVQAILQKLASYHPRDACRGPATLLRYNPDQAGELANQALCYLVDEWVRDFIVSPSDTSLTRLVRLRPRMTALPSMRGRSNPGNTYRLWCLALYQDAYEEAKKTIGIKDWKTKDLYREGEIVTERAEKLAALFTDIDPSALKAWARLSPSEIAYRVAAKRCKELPGLTPLYLKQSILPKMRQLARAINAALAKRRTLPS